MGKLDRTKEPSYDTMLSLHGEGPNILKGPWYSMENGLVYMKKVLETVFALCWSSIFPSSVVKLRHMHIAQEDLKQIRTDNIRQCRRILLGTS